MAMDAIPKRLRTNLPEYIEVRGEILLPWSEFERTNKEREAGSTPPFANPEMRWLVPSRLKTMWHM